MDFDDNAPNASNMPAPKYKRYRAPDWLPSDAFIPKQKSDELNLPIDVPANIRHKFGTKVVKEVLKDKQEVEKTLEQQARIRAESHKSNKSASSSRTVDFPSPEDSEYESLSHSVRQNIFPGTSMNYKISSTKEDYPSDVFNRRVPDPDQYRCHRDELSKLWYCF